MRRQSILVSATAILVVLTLCGSVLAFSGSGSGTVGDPYIITNVNELQEMADDLTAWYVLGNDIDATDTANWNAGQGFDPVGEWTGVSNNAFTGTFDGMGHSIQSLHISRIDNGWQGLFGCSWGATIQNVHLSNAEITADIKSGTLVGKACVDSIITNCSATGTVTLKAGTADSKSGGLIGFAVGGTHVDQCKSGVNVNASSRKQIGGLIGYLEGRTYHTLLSNSYSTGTVTGGGAKQGNLVGDADGSYVDRCYSCGNGKSLIGYNFMNPVITNSYWDKDNGASSSSYGGTGKTTSEMMQQATFVGWDFVDIWDIVENGTYPFLIAFEHKELVGLEISGPEEVAENFSAGYKAIAYYDNDSTRDVTDLALWVVEPNMYASIEGGALTTKDIVNDQSATILAGYTEGEITVVAEKTIDILAICPTGTALSFDGVDDYVDCGSDQSLDVTELTWSLWIKRAKTTYTNERALISNEGGGANTRGTYALQIDVGSQRQDKIQFVRHGDSTWLLSNTAIQDTDWHYIAVTRNSSGVVVIYIEGIPDSTGTIDTRTAFTKTVIGAGHTSYSNYNGLVDEVSIYNRALSGGEIQMNMHRRLTGDEPGLVGYWDFDEGWGQIVYDLSGNDNHGQLGSTPDVDASDPAWIESDAPIGRCTPYLIATGSIKEALKHKKASLDELEAAIAEEWTAYEALEELLDTGDYGDLKKSDIIHAMQQIHSSIQHEELSAKALQRSIEKLLYSLSALGCEPIPPPQPPLPPPPVPPPPPDPPPPPLPPLPPPPM